MAFERLDMKEAYCFGWAPGRKSWTDLAERSVAEGWFDENDPSRNPDGVRTTDVETAMAKDVDASYRSLATFYIDDLDDGTSWVLRFDNDSSMWDLSIRGCDKAPLPEQYEGFFTAELPKRIAIRCGTLLERARRIYSETLKRKLESGLMLEVNEVKLNRILFELENNRTMENVRSLKFKTV